MRFWIIIYIGMALFDTTITYICVNYKQFGIGSESNPLINRLMGQFGIWQGLLLCFLQEISYYFLILGIFYLLIRYVTSKIPEYDHFKIDILVFNIGIPFITISCALLHLFGGLSWVTFIILGSIDFINFLKLFMLIITFCSIFQAYYVYKLFIEKKKV